MSDHVHDCPKCNSWWPCDRDDCSPDDLCYDCRGDEIGHLREALASVEIINKALRDDLREARQALAAAEAEVERLQKQLTAAELELKKLRAFWKWARLTDRMVFEREYVER